MPYISESDLAELHHAIAQRDADLEKARILVRLITVRQVIEAGYEEINAAGLNPWCMNEGTATGDEKIRLYWAIS